MIIIEKMQVVQWGAFKIELLCKALAVWFPGPDSQSSS